MPLSLCGGEHHMFSWHLPTTWRCSLCRKQGCPQQHSPHQACASSQWCAYHSRPASRIKCSIEPSTKCTVQAVEAITRLSWLVLRSHKRHSSHSTECVMSVYIIVDEEHHNTKWMSSSCAPCNTLYSLNVCYKSFAKLLVHTSLAAI